MDIFMRLAILWLALLSTAHSHVPDEWPTSAPGRQGLDADQFASPDAHIRTELPHVRSLLIARHGALVFERYYGDASREEPHDILSMTKSVTSALVGIALKKGLISSLDNRVAGYFPEYAPGMVDDRLKSVTIRHLLTMTSGLDEMGLNFDHGVEDLTAEILKLRLAAAPGAGFRYSSPAAHLLGGVLRKASGHGVLAFAEAELFRPLGIGKVIWYGDKTGLQSGGMSALFRSRDLLKLGELYLRRGKRNGRELISPAYIADSVTVHSTGDFYGERVRYGYLWWITSAGGQDAYYARGYGGQYLMVLPGADLVVLCTSDWKQPEYPEHFAIVEKRILPALTSR